MQGTRTLKLAVMALIMMAFIMPHRADGMMFPPPERRLPQIFSVKYHHVDVKIDGQSVVTSVDQVFHNETGTEQEGMYIFPVPDGGTISRFSMYAGDREVEAKILDKDQARQIYESIVRQRKDPALLEYVGKNAFKARVYPIPANGDKRVKLQYSQVIEKEGGMLRYVYPMATERFSTKPLESVKIVVHLTAKVPITNIYSPTLEVDVKQTTPCEAYVTWEGKNLLPDRDLILYYTLSDSELPIQVLTHREPGGPGYFMLLASPKPAAQQSYIPKNVVFVFDRTGSMSGEKIDQAKAALRYCLGRLKPNDRFGVVAFNETATWFKNGLVMATKDNVAAAQKMVDDLDAQGGTNIQSALNVALEQYSEFTETFHGNRHVVFLTDGQPTVGETNTDNILKVIKAKLKSDIRISVFGVGSDVNAPFLDELAQMSKADADYVRPKESVEVKITAFFDKVSHPLLTDLKLTTSGATVSDMYPSENLPDLYKGGQLIIIGRYTDAGSVKFTLTGMASTISRSYSATVTLPKAEAANEFIPRLWASRKIGYLLDQIRLNKNKELIDEVVRLSKEFGIPTEYTSFLADERYLDISSADAVKLATESFTVASKQETGDWAVNQSVNARNMRNQSTIAGSVQRDAYVSNAGTAPAAVGGFKDYDGKSLGNTNYYYDSTGRTVSVNSVQNVGARTFYRKSNQWVDARYNNQKMYRVRQFSEAHFQLLQANSELAKYSTLGEVTVIMNGNAVQIGNDGKDKLTESELKEMLGKS